MSTPETPQENPQTPPAGDQPATTTTAPTWPQANEHGVYDPKEPTIEETSGGGKQHKWRAQTLQVDATTWVFSYEANMKIGSHSSGSAGLSRTLGEFRSAPEALRASLAIIDRHYEAVLSSQDSDAAKKVAAKAREQIAAVMPPASPTASTDEKPEEKPAEQPKKAGPGRPKKSKDKAPETPPGGTPQEPADAPDPEPKPYIESLQCRHDFTTEERQEIGMDLSRAWDHAARLEGEKKSVMADYKARIDNAKLACATLSSKLRDGFEMREMRVYATLDFKRGRKFWHLEETGEIVREDFITAEDRQMNLPLEHRPEFTAEELAETEKLVRDNAKNGLISADVLQPLLKCNATRAEALLAALEERGTVGPRKDHRPDKGLPGRREVFAVTKPERFLKKDLEDATAAVQKNHTTGGLIHPEILMQALGVKRDRADALLGQMEALGIVGPAKQAGPGVLIHEVDWRKVLKGAKPTAVPDPKPEEKPTEPKKPKHTRRGKPVEEGEGTPPAPPEGEGDDEGEDEEEQPQEPAPEGASVPATPLRDMTPGWPPPAPERTPEQLAARIYIETQYTDPKIPAGEAVMSLDDWMNANQATAAVRAAVKLALARAGAAVIEPKAGVTWTFKKLDAAELDDIEMAAREMAGTVIIDQAGEQYESTLGEFLSRRGTNPTSADGFRIRTELIEDGIAHSSLGGRPATILLPPPRPATNGDGYTLTVYGPTEEEEEEEPREPSEEALRAEDKALGHDKPDPDEEPRPPIEPLKARPDPNRIRPHDGRTRGAVAPRRPRA